jgi:hypothetical protein
MITFLKICTSDYNIGKIPSPTFPFQVYSMTKLALVGPLAIRVYRGVCAVKISVQTVKVYIVFIW